MNFSVLTNDEFRCLSQFFMLRVSCDNKRRYNKCKKATVQMKTNIEIKAKAHDFQRQKDLAQEIADSSEKLIYQDDTFFIVPHGRLKLRIFSPSLGELIYYERDDIVSPKKSNYCISETNSPYTLKDALSLALPVRGRIYKKRHLFIVGQTRIHFDEVESLGEG